jgi:hypothetical protein
MTMHKDYVISKYPDNRKIWRNKVEDLKHNLRSHQAIFSKPVNSQSGCLASYKITEISAKKKKPFEDELKYAIQLRRSSYLEVLSLEEWNISPMTLNNK